MYEDGDDPEDDGMVAILNSIPLPALDEEVQEEPASAEHGAEDSNANIFAKVVADFEAVVAKASPSRDFCSDAYLGLVVQGVAEASQQLQFQSFDAVFHYMADRKETQTLCPVALCWHNIYDETPARLKVNFSSSGSSAVENDPQIAKIFVIECKWSMLIQDLTTKKHFSVRGQFMPRLRCASNAGGECISELLGQWSPPPQAHAVFKRCFHVGESDEFSGNLRGERLLAETFPSWIFYHQGCVGHKIHSASSKTLSLNGEVLENVKGLTRCLLALQQPGMLAKLRELLRRHVVSHARLLHEPPFLSQDALNYREALKKFFIPKTCGAKNRLTASLLFSELLNGDLREKRALLHHCVHGCCKDLPSLHQKLDTWLQKLVTAVGCRVLNRSNWQSYHDSFNLIALLCGTHNILPEIASELFSSKSVQHGADILGLGASLQNADVMRGHGAAGLSDDKFEQMRVEQSQNLAIATDFMAGAPLDALWRLRVALHPQIELQEQFLKQTLPTWELEQVQKGKAGEARDYQMLSLARGDLVRRCLETSLDQLLDERLWLQLPHTHHETAAIFKTCLRPPAALYHLVAQPFSVYPTRLFMLLQADERVRIAHELVSSPDCVLDGFSKAFRAAFSTEESLVSEESLETLRLLAASIQCTSWSTEKLHSRHARRARSRAHTHCMQLKQIGPMHAQNTRPEWWEKLASSTVAPQECFLALLLQRHSLFFLVSASVSAFQGRNQSPRAVLAGWSMCPGNSSTSGTLPKCSSRVCSSSLVASQEAGPSPNA